jgi:hypothetical protein
MADIESHETIAALPGIKAYRRQDIALVFGLSGIAFE